LLGTVRMIKAFGALAAAGTPDQAALQVFWSLLMQQVLNFSCSNYLLQFLYFKIDDLTYSIDEAAVRL
jgi:biopolymer transport protein ExbB